eukprot:UN21612
MINQKMKNENTVFGCKKGSKFNMRIFSGPQPSNCGWFNCYFPLITTSLSQKLKRRKYSFWLQKVVKNPI